MLRTDIGEGDDALQCTTDSTLCCVGAGRAGEFYFPDGIQVPVSGNDLSRPYYRSRGSQLIHLNRRSSGTVTGQFRCEIPDASGTLVNLSINIGMYLQESTKRLKVPINTYTCSCAGIIYSYLHFLVDVYIHVSITPVFGTNTAGETYILESFATATGSSDPDSYTHLTLPTICSV